MASTQTWSEYNGASSVTETGTRAEANWKNIDDSTTAYTASIITAGNNAFVKVQALKYAGVWNSLSAGTYKVSTAAPGTGQTVVAAVIVAGITSSATSSGYAAASTTGTAFNFNSSTTPFGAGTASTTASGTMYANAYATQLQTTISSAPGDLTAAVTITATWTES